jgi:hypothetical protein
MTWWKKTVSKAEKGQSSAFYPSSNIIIEDV